MATVVDTNLGRTFNTTAGTKTVAAVTPTVNDLIVIIVAGSMTADMGVISVTDDNADGLGTYTHINHYFDATPDRYTGFYVRNALIGSGTSTTFTAPITGDTGGGLSVIRVTGMSRTGASAVRQEAGQANGAALATPTATMAAAVLTGNAVIGAVCSNSNPATMTPRGSPAYTEMFDVGYATPPSGLEAMNIDSGETGTSIAWGSTSASTYSCMVIELDTSAAATTEDPFPFFGGGYYPTEG